MKKPKLLLVGWDSADWKIMRPLIDAGTLPGIASLLQRGVSGTMTTLEPQLSPMLWTSIATGKMAYHHGVHGFTEVDPETRTVVPVSAATRRCKTVWEILGERGLRSHVVSWFATQGERDLNGKMVSNMFCHLGGVKAGQDPENWPAPLPGTYWPPELAETMNELRVSPHEVDPDQIIRLFVPEAPKVDQTKDPRLWNLAQRLAETFSAHSAATHLMESDPAWDFMAVYYRAIDEISHAFMPYHPPRMEGIPEEDFLRYRHVVESTYRLHDLFLKRLIHLAGPEAAILLVSDHGFHSDHLRPKFTPRVPAGITVWHRPQGVVIAGGPGFRSGETIYGARLLDVTPTILHHFGLPIGADMEGRVLEEAFAGTLAERRRPESIPSWENPGGLKRERTNLRSMESKALLDQFVALGYIEEVSEDPAQAIAETERENNWNLARACIYGGRYTEALPMLEEICHAAPGRTDYAQVLASCQLQLGLLDEASSTIARAQETFGRTEQAQLIQASIAVQREDYNEALRLLEIVREKNPEEMQLQQLLSQSYLRLRRWEEAEAAARKVIAADSHNPQAFLTLARLQLHQQKSAEAAESALEVIGYQYGNPQGHFLLGAALAQSGEWVQAERPLLNAIQLAPKFLRSYRLLARVYSALGEPERSSACLLQARVILDQEKRDAASKSAALRRGVSERGAVRAREDAIRKEAADRRAAEEAKVEPMEFVLVSGLPRSGTSLMMQILRAGGMPIMTDGKRLPAQDNPEGYWEWEGITKLPKNPRIIEEARGKVIKVISALLPSLPVKHRYRIIIMKRPVEQVIESQRAMLEHSGQKPKSDKEHLTQVQKQHSEAILETLRKSDRVELLEIDFPELVADPAPSIARIAEFLGEQFQVTPAVAACVKPKLHRNR